MGFSSYSDIDPAKVQTGVLQNTVSLTQFSTGALGTWFDDSMLIGYPSSNAYAGNANSASLLLEDRGIQHWQLADGESEHLLEWFMHSTYAGDAPYSMVLCDYVMFYPQIDCNIDTLQTLNNDITLPRHGTGEGLRAFIVSTNAASPSIGQYEITYTNSDGIGGRVSSGFTNPANNFGQLLNSGFTTVGQLGNPAPFISVAAGCKGIQKIDSIRWIIPPGGRAAIVLVRTIASISMTEQNSIAEAQYFERMPEIPKGAYLGILRHPGGAVTTGTRYFGQITTIKS